MRIYPFWGPKKSKKCFSNYISIFFLAVISVFKSQMTKQNVSQILSIFCLLRYICFEVPRKPKKKKNIFLKYYLSSVLGKCPFLSPKKPTKMFLKNFLSSFLQIYQLWTPKKPKTFLKYCTSSVLRINPFWSSKKPKGFSNIVRLLLYQNNVSQILSCLLPYIIRKL